MTNWGSVIENVKSATSIAPVLKLRDIKTDSSINFSKFFQFRKGLILFYPKPIEHKAA